MRKQTLGLLIFSIVGVSASYLICNTVGADLQHVDSAETSLPNAPIKHFNLNLFIAAIILLLIIDWIYILVHNKKWFQVGISFLIAAWELFAYVLSNYFFEIDEEINSRLFYALSLLGLAILIFFLG